jgi:hypothetical protein
MISPELKLVDHMLDITLAVSLSLGCMGCIEYYYGNVQKSITINKVSIGMTIASIALIATGIVMFINSKKQ